MTVTRTIARPLLASTFLIGSVDALKNAKSKAPAAEPVAARIKPLLKKVAPSVPIPDDTVTLVRINAGVQLIGALTLATGRAPRLSSAVLAASLVPTTLAGHSFWDQTDPAARANHRIHFAKNVSMLGGLLLATVDTDGKPGVAWRTKRLAKDARRGSTQLAKTARREAKLAAKGNLPG